jgi:PadR family transcriptional regulator PadR
MKGEKLGEFEEVVLLSVRKGASEANGIVIQRILGEDGGRSVSLGAIYAALDRLARKRYVVSWLGEPTAVRGGKRKRHYEVTPEGLDALRATRSVRDKLWAAV